MSKKTQTELEQPAKVYQLDAVDEKVERALVLLNTVVNNTSSLVSESQLSSVKTDIENDTDDKIFSAVEKIHLRYDPYVKGFAWVATIVGASVLGQFAIQVYGWMSGGK